VWSIIRKKTLALELRLFLIIKALEIGHKLVLQQGLHSNFSNGPASWANGYSCRNALNFEFPPQNSVPYITNGRANQGISE